jgi:hypothetical protein
MGENGRGSRDEDGDEWWQDGNGSFARSVRCMRILQSRLRLSGSLDSVSVYIR